MIPHVQPLGQRGAQSLGDRSRYRVASRTGDSRHGARHCLVGQPQAIRLDNGPEFLADRFAVWCADRGIARRCIQPGKPIQNTFVERFNRIFRHKVLDAYVFESLDQVREISAEWTREYNEERPHDMLDGMPLTSFRVHMTTGGFPLILSP